MKTGLFLSAALLLAGGAGAAAPVPFHHGVNLSTWFQPQKGGGLTVSRFGEQDFRNLKALGVDGVRIPINFEALTGPAPDYRVDPRLFPFLDRALDWAAAQDIAVVIDNHSDPTDPRIKTDLGRFLEAVWTQLAGHYKDRPVNVLFEVQNEPHDLGQDWAPLQQRAITAIRAVDQTHTVVVGGDHWNSIQGMKELPRYADQNLVYTFHFYDPFVFTHQGANWTDLKDLSGVAFPPVGQAPNVQGSGKSAWVPKAVQDYYASDAVKVLADSLDQAAAFGRERGVPVWCGELGVYNLRADPVQRVNWYRTVRGLLEDRKIPWTSWDYKNSFGLFQKDSDEVFDQDLNLPLVEALGFNAVPQVPRGPVKETAGFVLYDDSFGSGSLEGGYNHGGVVDYLDPNNPHGGQFSIKMQGFDRYDLVSWNFAPRKDLAALAPAASLSFWARASAKFAVQLRFVDGAVPGGLPWRNAATLDSTMVPPDGQWHQVTLPLSAFQVTGAWDGTWHPAAGPFAWNRVEHFEIVAELSDLKGITLGFDDIQVVAR